MDVESSLFPFVTAVKLEDKSCRTRVVRGWLQPSGWPAVFCAPRDVRRSALIGLNARMHALQPADYAACATCLMNLKSRDVQSRISLAEFQSIHTSMSWLVSTCGNFKF